MSATDRVFRIVAACMSCASLVCGQNQPPDPPVINEPAPAAVVSPFDVHMETAPFSDPDPQDQHAASDWELWTTTPSERVWYALGMTGTDRYHVHLGDGTFEGSHTGWARLFAATSFELRVRHMDDSGVAGTQWSPWAIRQFVTTPLTQVPALVMDDVHDEPEPRWTGPGGQPIDLPSGSPPPSLRLETGSGQLLLRIDGDQGPGNAITNPAALPAHAPVRIVVEAGGVAGTLVLPETNLAFAEHHGCHVVTVRLPALSLPAGQQSVLWVNADGATYVGSLAQPTPVFTAPARQLMPPYVVREPGYRIDVVATNLHLPVNIAFVPGAGTAPGDPKFYVTELYGTVKTVTNDGTVLNYATGLLNYAPSGVFPGNGEQGLTGIAVEPLTKDVFVALLRRSANGENYPRIVRLSSTDGGRTASSQQLVLDMPGESQGQSHQIAALEIRNGVLWCHNGDGFEPATARNLDSFRGKVLRMNLDGSPIPSNPFYDGGPRDSRDYIWAYGLRNPFGGAWRAADDSRYEVENGPAVDRFAKIVMGRDYRWAGTDFDMRFHAIHNWAPPVCPVNIAFVQPETFGGSGFPSGKMDHAFIAESGPTYGEGRQDRGKRISEWVLDAAGNLVQGPTPFVEYVGDSRATMVGLAAGPDGLYFTDLYRDAGNQPYLVGARVFRISHGAADDCNRNGAPDWCEIETGAVTDFDGDGVPDECNLLQASSDRLSVAAGGQIDFTLRAGPAHGGLAHLLLGTMSGTAPGVPAGAIQVPLNMDFWFTATLGAANSAVLVNTLGDFPAAGVATASIVVPPGLASVLQGLTAHHAFVVYDVATAQFVLASNAVPLRLEL